MRIWASSPVVAAIKLLPRRDRMILLSVAMIQLLLAVLDLAGVFLLGLVALAATAVVSNKASPLIERMQDLLSVQDQFVLIAMLASVAALTLLVKTVASYLVTRRSLRFLANRQAVVSSRLVGQLLSQPLLFVQRRTSQETCYALTAGANAITLGVLGNAVVLVSELMLAIVFAVGLAIFDLTVTLFSIAFFGFIGILLNRLIAHRANRLSRITVAAEVASWASLQQALVTYREATVSGRRPFLVQQFRNLRWQAASTQADTQIVNQIPKYVFEMALIVGAGLLAISQLQMHDVATAVGVVVVFLTAGTRMIPSLLRLQNANIAIKTASGAADSLLSLAHALEISPRGSARVSPDWFSATEMHGVQGQQRHLGFAPQVRLERVTIRYPGTPSPAVEDVSLNMQAGTSLALVGPTGAGKSTLADLILGVLEPDTGIVTIGGKPPEQATFQFPGAIAYVPQETAVIDGSVRSNVCLGLPPELVDDELVWSALERAQLADYVQNQPHALDTEVGEHGVRLSGGQRQRLGLARALYTQPRLIVLDEATSALDAETEHAVSETLLELGKEVTLIIIAHRLATVRHCDQIAYLESGRLKAIGSFNEVRAAVPQFDRQAHLLGL